jgi:hypothetical protein
MSTQGRVSRDRPRDRRGFSPELAICGLALLSPLLAAPVSWLLSGLTTSAQACAGGEPAPLLARLVIPVLLVPALIILLARRAGASTAITVLAIIASVVLALPTVYVTGMLWWAAHACYS